MDVKVDKVNVAFLSLMQNPNQLITFDAIFFLLPNRYKYSKLNIPDMPMIFWITNWLDPLFSCFQNLAIHEAVNDEIFSGQAEDYVNARLTSIPPTLFLHKDSQLSSEELIIRNTKEALIAQNTKYIPELDNKDDRGEVKTLAYISTKNLIYFASHDDNALKLIKNCEELKTSLDEQKALLRADRDGPPRPFPFSRPGRALPSLALGSPAFHDRMGRAHRACPRQIPRPARPQAPADHGRPRLHHP